MEQRMDYAPIVLFAYKRPDSTLRLLEQLADNRLAAESRLFVHIDGPRKDSDRALIERVAQIAQSRQWCGEVNVIRSATNLGCAASVIKYVTELCAKFGRVIVLEDDLQLSPDFLLYMNQSLVQYADDERVMQVSGYIPPIPVAPGEHAYFLPVNSSWGWGTWQRAWKHFDASAPGFLELRRDPALRRCFDLDGCYPYFYMLQLALAGEIKVWSIFFELAIFRQSGLVLYPARTLVNNTGFDDVAENCRKANPLYLPRPNAACPELPQKVELSHAAFTRFCAHHRERQRYAPARPGFWSRAFKPIADRLPPSLKRAGVLLCNRAERVKSRELRRLSALPPRVPGETAVLGAPVKFIDAPSFLSMRDSIFVKKQFRFASAATSPRILDCGANIGLATLYWKKLYPDARIIAFEPDPDAFAALAQNCATWKLANVVLSNKAVAAANGTAQFLRQGDDSGRLLSASGKASPETIVVDTVRLYDYLAEPVELLKLDIEGAETEVIADLAPRLGNVAHLFVEYHSFHNRPQEADRILSILREAGFRWHLLPDLRSRFPFEEIPDDHGMDQRLNIFAYR